MSDNKQLHFKTNVQLKSIIGKDLINDDNIAILELVKNSFDADAKKVTVKYLNLKSNDDKNIEGFSENSSRLIIQDNGLGMNLDDIQNKWLNIAYSGKKNLKTQYKRRMAGAKGIGRFSCDRLGKYLNLYSKTSNDNKYIKLTIDWKEFEIDDESIEIQSIPLNYEYLTNSEFENLGFEAFNHGVLLEIIKLRSTWAYSTVDKSNSVTWDVEKLVGLKKYLEKLINPNQAFEDNDFGIYLDAPEFIEENNELSESDKFIGLVENQIFDKLDFKSTSIEVETVDNGLHLLTELKDKGQTIFWIKEKNVFYPDVKNVKATVYYLNPYAKAFFTRQTGIQSVNYGSIFLFINGFRIPPYGEVGNDWLGLDRRKAQGHSRYIGLRETVGHIEIWDDDNQFQIISSREGVVKNDSFHKLTDSEQNNSFFFKAFRRLERYVVDGLDWDSAPLGDLSSIQNKIIIGEVNDEDLVYREDDLTKQRRIYSTIHSIISAKTDDVIEIYINENLITQKVEEEKKQSEKEFEKLIQDFENKKIDAETLNKILKNKAKQNAELEKEIKEFSKYTTNEATSKALLELQNYKKTVNDQTVLIEQLKKKLEDLEKEKASAAKKVKDAKSEAEKAKKELLETKEQNLFLKNIKSQDLDDVLNLMHHIGISTGTIQNYIKGAVFKLDNNIDFEKEELKNVFSKLNYELNKIFSISKFATKANFKVETKDTQLDIVSFIEQYLINIIKPFLSKKVSLVVYEHSIEEFITTFKPIELIIIIDNLINNAKKAINAKASNNPENYSGRIEIDFEKISDTELQISFKDNGVGVPKANQKKIFDYGFTTTEGSGLGLTHIKELVEKINGTIVLNEDYNDGAEFIIKINKE